MLNDHRRHKVIPIRPEDRKQRKTGRRDAAALYVVCEPASHYYAVMTRSAWMPVLIGERI